MQATIFVGYRDQGVDIFGTTILLTTGLLWPCIMFPLNVLLMSKIPPLLKI